MKRNSLWLTVVVALLLAAAVAIVVVVKLTERNDSSPEGQKPVGGGPRLVSTSAPATSTAPAVDADKRAQATRQYDAAMALLAEGKLVEARTELSAVYFSDALAGDLQDKARAALEDLADKTIFSRQVLEGDPYCFTHTFASGEVLQAIERKLELHVPTELILRINNIPRDVDIRAGQTIKLVQGPFHAVVSKKDFVMDIYLQRGDLPKTFVKRLKVGLGVHNGTPEGRWHVRLGRAGASGKLRRARYDPPPNSQVRNPIDYGQAGYPFGEKGLWIPLEGDDDSTRMMTNYGIHSTNEPQSIGKEGSLGCIRMSDNDIELVYSLLYEKWSTVVTKP